MHSIEVSQLLTGQKYPRRIPLLGVSTEFKPKKPRRGVSSKQHFPVICSWIFPVIGVGWIQTLPPCWGLSRAVFALDKAVAEHGPQINVCKIRIQQIWDVWGPNSWHPTRPFFSCQNVHYKAFHCKHELDTWNQQTTAIGTITEVACKKLLWISSQNWKRDVWNFDTKKMIL